MCAPAPEPSNRPPAAAPARLARRLARRLDLYARLVRLDRPIGVLLLLWPTLDALWLAAHGFPGWSNLLVFCAGTLLMRSAGCAVNDIADRSFDGHVERTAGRVLATGLVTVREAWLVAGVLAALAAALLPLLNRAACELALLAVVFTVTYPRMKRFFPLPQAYLGIAFSFGIPMAYVALQQHVPPVGWWLFTANLFWVIAYDTEYAMVDRDDDLKIGIRSSAILFGAADVALVMASYALYLGLLAALGIALGLGAAFYAGLALAAGCALFHFTLIRGRSRAGCMRAFLHNHWLGAAIFAGIVIDLGKP
jgi:4-hydroxybenzoate polyprenyltransferase